MDKKILALINCKEEYPAGRELGYQTACLDALGCDVFLLNNPNEQGTEAGTALHDFKEFAEIMRDGAYDYVLFTDNSYFCISDYLTKAVTEFTREAADIYVLEKTLQKEKVSSAYERKPELYFVLAQLSFAQEVLKAIGIENAAFETAVKTMVNRADTCVGFFDRTGVEMAYEESLAVMEPYLAIAEYCFPVFRKDAVKYERVKRLETNYGDSVYKALKFLRENELCDTELIYDYIIYNNDPFVTRDFLCGDYILSQSASDSPMTDKALQETVVLAHLYYPELFDKCVSYLSNVPETVKIFISVRGENERALLQQKSDALGLNAMVIVARNIGRDWGALYFDLWPHAQEYKYICFLHDKKSTGGRGSASIGVSFMNMVWDSFLENKDTFRCALEKLVLEERVGLLTSQVPYHSGYVKLLGDTWTVCYDETKRVGDMIGMKLADMKRTDQPFAMASMFLCKREVLATIVDYPFTVEDFPGEPLATDGSFNHALERIVVYAAKEKGMYTATVRSERIALNTMLNYESMLHVLLRDTLNATGGVDYRNNFSGHFFTNMIKIIKFTFEHEDLYIYGAGNNGIQMAEFLEGMGTDYKGFITSSGMKNSDEFRGKPVIEIDKLSGNPGILVAVDRAYVGAVEKAIVDNGFAEYLVPFF